MSTADRVSAHYTRGNLAEVLLGALQAAGYDPDNLTLEDLAPIDEFHIRGREATPELAQALALGPSMSVLDVGSGVGGPARHVANLCGCAVTGIDLTEEFCDVATLLSGKVGLADKVSFRPANALAMPFGDDAFDAAYSQHVAMNIEDKAGLYREIFRVVKPGGRFGLYDILQGDGGEVVYPAPWAKDPSTSFLSRPDDLLRVLADAGFEVESHHDRTEPGRAWFVARGEQVAREGPPPLGPHLLLGPIFGEMVSNMVRNLMEDRICVMQVVCRKP